MKLIIFFMLFPVLMFAQNKPVAPVKKATSVAENKESKTHFVVGLNPSYKRGITSAFVGLSTAHFNLRGFYSYPVIPKSWEEDGFFIQNPSFGGEMNFLIGVFNQEEIGKFSISLGIENANFFRWKPAVDDLDSLSAPVVGTVVLSSIVPQIGVQYDIKKFFFSIGVSGPGPAFLLVKKSGFIRVPYFDTFIVAGFKL